MTTPIRVRPSPMASVLGASGPIARLLPDYDERPGQIEMAETVASALARSEHAVIEAGTGTGKSMAYLVPAIFSGKTVIVSTANKALQEQLIRKDIPFLQQVLPIRFTAAMIKGRSNYLCLDRFRDEEGFQRLTGGSRGWKRALEWKDTTTTGDLEDLEISIPPDIRGRMVSTTRTCIGDACDFFDRCFVELARQRAEESKIIICNHALLLADLHLRDMGAYLLPERDAIVLDEAHHLEEATINALSVQLAPSDIAELLEYGLLRRYVDSALLERGTHAGQRLAIDLQSACAGYQHIITEALPSGEAFADLVQEMGESLRRENPQMKRQQDKDSRRFERMMEWIDQTATTARLVSRSADEDSVRYSVPAAEGGRGREPALRWSPIDVANSLQEILFSRYPTICTSATLATRGATSTASEDEPLPNQAFSYFRSRVGIDAAQERLIASPFDYPNQCLLYVARSMPEFAINRPDEYAEALASHLDRLLAASRGRAFCLFTSYRTLDRVWSLLAPSLPFPTLRQGDAPRPELLRRFKAKPGSVLFATRSFWEGVDVVGEGLSLVAIDKLPFSSPDEPVVQARVARMKRAEQDWFGDLMLPQATLQLKQGFGRLIRSPNDRGVVAILDSRILRKSYGRQVLAALPPARRTDRIEVVEAFFQSEPTQL